MASCPTPARTAPRAKKTGSYTIVFNAGLNGTIGLDGELPSITGTNLTIIGPATAPGVTIDGRHMNRLFEVNSGATLNLQDLTLSNGSRLPVARFRTWIRLSVSDSTFSGNVATFAGGAMTSDDDRINVDGHQLHVCREPFECSRCGYREHSQQRHGDRDEQHIRRQQHGLRRQRYFSDCGHGNGREYDLGGRIDRRSKLLRHDRGRRLKLERRLDLRIHREYQQE